MRGSVGPNKGRLTKDRHGSQTSPNVLHINYGAPYPNTNNILIVSSLFILLTTKIEFPSTHSGNYLILQYIVRLPVSSAPGSASVVHPSQSSPLPPSSDVSGESYDVPQLPLQLQQTQQGSHRTTDESTPSCAASDSHREV